MLRERLFKRSVLQDEFKQCETQGVLSLLERPCSTTKRGGFDKRNLFPHSSGGPKSKTKVSEGLDTLRPLSLTCTGQAVFPVSSPGFLLSKPVPNLLF